MKRLFYLSATILMLSLAFHFGYTTARAQAPGNPVVTTIQGSWSSVVTANGNVYTAQTLGPYSSTFQWTGNVFAGGATPARQESWGQLKSRYAPSHTPTSQTPTDR